MRGEGLRPGWRPAPGACAGASRGGAAAWGGLLLMLLLAGCMEDAGMRAGQAQDSRVKVRWPDADGLLTVVETSRVVRSDAEWRSRLTPEQYRIARGKGTEPAFCGALYPHKDRGVYRCVCCNLPLFASESKFDSRTGWPSFFQPVASENVVTRRDASAGMIRTEVLCALCDAHLGHVFDDGPPPTGLRYCLNSAALLFEARPGGVTP